MDEHELEKYGIRPFSGTEYQPWAYRVKLFLECGKLLDYIQKNKPAVPPTDWIRRDLEARNIIVKCCANRILPMIFQKTTAKEMWLTLQRKFGSMSQANINLYRDRLMNLRCAEDEKLSGFFGKFEQAVTNLEQAHAALS